MPGIIAVLKTKAAKSVFLTEIFRGFIAKKNIRRRRFFYDAFALVEPFIPRPKIFVKRF